MEGEKIGHFIILREIGRGGFGTVYLAYDEETNGHVALKKVENFSERKHERRGLYYYKKNRENFRYENIISINETIKSGGDMYYSMPVADGMGGVSCTETNYVPKTLELVIKERLKQGGGWFSEDEILDVVIPVARALAAVDKYGLKHRDVKPANIIFIKGKPMLSDFGLAAQDTSSLSRAGTADYTPPSWFADSGGDPDMWGFAMTFFALFSGKPPSESKNNRKYPKCWSERDLLKNREIWDKFAQIVFRVKNENESERFPNWGALLDALYKLRGYADKYRHAEQQPPAKKIKLPTGFLAAFLAVLIFFVGFAMFSGGSESAGGAENELKKAKAKNAELLEEIAELCSGTGGGPFNEEIKNYILNGKITVPQEIKRAFPVSEITRILHGEGFDLVMAHTGINYRSLTKLKDSDSSEDSSMVRLYKSGVMTRREFLEMCREQFGIRYEIYPFQRVQNGYLDDGKSLYYFLHYIVLLDD